MHQPIAHGAHKIPGHLWIFLFDFGGDLTGCLSDNNKIQFRRLERFYVFLEPLKVHPSRE